MRWPDPSKYPLRTHPDDVRIQMTEEEDDWQEMQQADQGYRLWADSLNTQQEQTTDGDHGER